MLDIRLLSARCSFGAVVFVSTQCKAVLCYKVWNEHKGQQPSDTEGCQCKTLKKISDAERQLHDLRALSQLPLSSMELFNVYCSIFELSSIAR